jgi:hypothetical protein
MPITTGQLFSQLLIAVTPTAVGSALNNLTADSTVKDWMEAVQKNQVGENPATVPQLVTQCKTQSLFQALLAPVYDNKGNPFPLALVLKNRIWTIGTTPGLLNSIWVTPPHPPGADVIRLVNLLNPFDETK